MSDIEFARPDLLYVLLALPLLGVILWPWARGGILYSAGASGRAPGVPAVLALGLPRILRLATLACLVLALAHPRAPEVVRNSVIVGKSIVIAVDISTSMLAEDMETAGSRLTVAREAAVRFAEQRPEDELTLVAFAGQAVTRVPPTTDASVVVAGIESLEVQLVLDGTDISAALLNSMARLLESEREELVVVLLTDGAHNGTGVAPLIAARAAAALGIRIHSIALLGEPDLESASPALRAAVLARQNRLASDMETVLDGLSRVTGGEYFRAGGGMALDSIYRRIGEIEAPEEQVTQTIVYRSLRLWPLLLALLLIGIEAIWRGSRLGLVP